MTSFRTAIPAKKSSTAINHKHQLFFIGSCFSTHIFNQVKALHFSAFSNPYGVLFNPASITQALDEVLAKKVYTQHDLVNHNDLYHSFQHHSSFSAVKADETIENINYSIVKAHHFLQNTDYLFITFGSAWAYKYTNGEIVANCHKIPNKAFEKVLLSVEEIVILLKKTIKQLNDFNSKLQVIFTVSPVRHLKDGFEENTVSKSILRTAIYHLQQQNKHISYFPAYEIMLDDLRDYRFYNEDMLHPNSVAINYIFEQFSSRYFSEETQLLNKRIAKLNVAREHRFLNEHTEAAEKHKAFIAAEKEAIQNLLKTIRLR